MSEELDAAIAQINRAALRQKLDRAGSISAEDARHVLWHFGHPDGWRPGTFTERLITAAACADLYNLGRLATGFPGIAAAVNIMQTRRGGVDELRRIAGSLS